MIADAPALVQEITTGDVPAPDLVTVITTGGVPAPDPATVTTAGDHEAETDTELVVWCSEPWLHWATHEYPSFITYTPVLLFVTMLIMWHDLH